MGGRTRFPAVWVSGLIGLCLLLGAVASRAASVSIVDDRGVRVELVQPIRRVVTLSPSLTETVCALGACARLVGTDRFSQWPPTVRSLPKLGGLEDTQVERIVSLRPDVVLVAVSARVIDRLESLGLKVVALEPRTLAQVQQVLHKVDEVLGKSPAPQKVWQRIQEQVDEAAKLVPGDVRGQRAYFEVASTPHAASEASFVGELLTRLGLLNIVPAKWGPFPALNAEWVVKAQPDWILGAAMDVQGMTARPGWSSLKALKVHKACAFTEAEMDALMRAGPRLGEGAQTIAKCLASSAGGPR